MLGGAAVSWPLAARAQQPERMRRIGVLMSQASGDPVGQARNVAFLQGLQELGWTIGRNVHIDYRWAPEDVGQGSLEERDGISRARARCHLGYGRHCRCYK